MCFEEKNFHRCTVACKGGTTSGLNCHLQIHHCKEYAKNPANQDTGTTLANIFPKKPKEQYFTLDEIKKQYKVVAASWAIEEAVPFYMFGRPTFRNVFKPFNKKADQVTNIDRGIFMKR